MPQKLSQDRPLRVGVFASAICLANAIEALLFLANPEWGERTDLDAPVLAAAVIFLLMGIPSAVVGSIAVAFSRKPALTPFFSFYFS